jgi:hypothetical protein
MFCLPWSSMSNPRWLKVEILRGAVALYIEHNRVPSAVVLLEVDNQL